MHSFTLTRGVFCLYVVLISSTAAWCENNPDIEMPAIAPKITITVVDVRDRHFRLDYKVENGPRLDIWVCDAMSLSQWGEPDFEAVPSEDGRTFILRKRTGLAWDMMRDQIKVRYVRLKAGKRLSGSLVIPLPAQSQPIVSSEGVLRGGDQIQRILLEIGYYQGDLPARLLDAPHMSEVLHFNEINEYRRSSGMEVLFYSDGGDSLAQSELLLQTAVSIRPMSCEAIPNRQHPAPDLRRCNRMEITYEPSALEYFFSYEGQRSELKPAQMRRLQSVRKVVVDDAGDVKEFISQVSRGVFQGISVGPAKAHVVCYQGKDSVATLDVYRDCFLTEAGEPFSFRDTGDTAYSGRFRRLIVRSIGRAD